MNKDISQWSKPTVISDADVAFGGFEDLMPPMDLIPAEFHNMSRDNKWTELQTKWFYEGLPQGTEFVFKDGIDGKAALRHLKAIQRSFAPKHEHKRAAVAWLMSIWCRDVILPAK